MTDLRPYCVNCKTRFQAKKNGYLIPYTKNSTQSGDLWECPNCGVKIVEGFGKPFYRRRR